MRVGPLKTGHGPETEEGRSKWSGEINPKPPLPPAARWVYNIPEGREILQGPGEAGRMGRGHWEVEGNRWAAPSKSKAGRNVNRHKGIVPHPKSGQEGLTVRFVD